MEIIPKSVIHEDSNLDENKNLIFIRLVYLCELISDIKDIKLQVEEHSEYKFIKSLKELHDGKISPFLFEVFEKMYLFL